MGRQSITGGVTPKGRHRIQFDLRIEGVRYRPSLRWVPSEATRPGVSLLALAPHPATSGDPLSQTIRGPAFLGELGPHARAQSPVGGETTWSQHCHHALGVRRLDRRDYGDGPLHAAGGDERGPTKFAGRIGLATDRLTHRLWDLDVSPGHGERRPRDSASPPPNTRRAN
jgi:hypothetical protein